MKRFMNKKVATIGLAAGLALGAAGAAFAYWTSSGSGTGTGTTAAQSSDLAYSNNTISDMAPGTAAQDFTATVTNNSTTQNAYVANVYVYLTVSENSSIATQYPSYTCSSQDYTLDGVVASTYTSGSPLQLAGWTATDIADGGGTASTTASSNTIGFNDLNDTNQDACQQATVTLHYTSN